MLKLVGVFVQVLKNLDFGLGVDLSGWLFGSCWGVWSIWVGGSGYVCVYGYVVNFVVEMFIMVGWLVPVRLKQMILIMCH